MKATRILALAVGLAALPVLAFAEEGHDTHGDKAKGEMPEMCRKMMAEREGMMSNMAKMDAALEEKLAAVKDAKGNAKVDALTDLVEALITQRKGMHAHMMSGMPKMMGHMMSHTGEGGMMGKDMAMANCPMMKDVKDLDAAGDGKSDDHSAHH